jgi:sulfite exporter TauE/SafE
MDCCATLDPAYSTDLLLLLTLGLTISVGHCTGMCGPLVLAYSSAQVQQGGRPRGLLARILLYNAGRITSYALLGMAMGLVGSALFMGARGNVLEGVLSMLIAVVMILLGISLLGWLRGLTAWERLLASSALLCRIKALLRQRSLGSSYALGFANGWLPCGPVYAAAMAAASTGSLWKGGAVMLAFGAGTVPVLLALALGSGGLTLSRRRFFSRLGAVFVLLVGVQLLLRGMAAIGWVEHLRYGEFVVW